MKTTGATMMTIMSLSLSAVDTGLLGYWTFDAIVDGKILDLSGNGRHGRVHGAPELVDGPSGKALLFKTNADYVDFGAPVIPPGDFSIAVRLNCDDAEKQFFLGQYKYEDPRRLVLAARNGAVRIQIGKIADSRPIIRPGQWHDLLFTRKDGVVKVRVDGKTVLRTELPGQVIQTENLILGKIFVPDRDSFRFAGRIDELKIWKGALPNFGE